MTQRRYSFSFVGITRSGDYRVMGFTATIETDLETAIEQVKKRIAENTAKEGVLMDTDQIVLMAATQLDTVRPPTFVELPTAIRQSLEQIVGDVLGNGRMPHTQSVKDVRDWLDAVKGGS